MATWFVSAVKVYWGLNFLYCPLKNPPFLKGGFLTSLRMTKQAYIPCEDYA